MKTYNLKNIYILYIISVIFLLVPYYNAFSQEEDEDGAVEQREKWFYIQRAYPYDTVPQNGYANAIEQKNQLIQNNGYQLSGINASWTTLGPQPLNGVGGMASGRISALVYDKRDLTGN